MAVRRWALSRCWLPVTSALVLSAALTPVTAIAVSLEDIPTYPGATLRDSRYHSREHLEAEFWVLLPEEANYQQVGDRARAAAEQYVELMKGAGWVLERENRQRRGGEFSFRKEAIKLAQLHVAARGKPIEGKMRNYVSFLFDLRRLIPFEDVLGRDATDVPRYPGSVRVKWMHLLGDYSAKYLVVSSEQEVRAFFEDAIPEHGWQPGPGAGDLNYVKAGAELTPDAAQRDAANPLSLVKGAIPTTLSVHLSDEDGIIHIGIGRTSGAGDSGTDVEGDLAPGEPPPDEPDEVLASIDVDNDLPVYTGLKLEARWTDPLSLAGEEIVKLRYVKAGAEMAEALAMAQFYLAQMQERGWEVADDEWYGIGRTLLFRKGAVRVKVAIKAVGRFPIPEGARPITIPVEVEITVPMPSEDVAGEDVEGIPRFPGSRRFYHLEAGIDQIVKFKAITGLQEVEWFFVHELPEHGWAFAGNDSTGLLFVPASTAPSATAAFASGKLVPTTLKIKVDDMLDGSVKIGMDLTKGD